MAKITNEEWNKIKAEIAQNGIYVEGIYEIKRVEFGYTMFANYANCRLQVDASRNLDDLRHSLYLERNSGSDENTVIANVLGRYDLSDGRVFLLRESIKHDKYYATEIIGEKQVDRLSGNFKDVLYYIGDLEVEARRNKLSLCTK